MNPALNSAASTPDVKSDSVLTAYRKMLLIRLCEEKIRQEYAKDEMKTPVHLGIGGEAISVGVMACLPKNVQAFGTYRNHALYLSLTDDVDGFFAEIYGKATGPGKGKAGSMHLALPERGMIATSAVVASTIPVAVGYAFANAYKETHEPVVCFFGDGAVEEGVFQESLNFACLKKLPILFVCEDNDLAIHTPTRDRQGYRSIPDLVKAYPCHAASAEGFDIQEVIHQTKHVLARMAEDSQPGFLHFKYFRYMEHVGPSEDFKFNYRARPSETEWVHWDPLLRYEKHLQSHGYSATELQAVRKSLQERIDRSVVAAQQAPFPDPSELYKDLLI